jgi:hypothetical protein
MCWDRSSKSIHCIECPTDPLVAEEEPIGEGVAGASARREYERRAAKRDAAIAETWGRGRLGRLVHAVTTEPQSTRAWETGAWGEEALAAELATSKDYGPSTIVVFVAPAGTSTTSSSPRRGSSSSTRRATRGTIRIRDRGWSLRHDYRLYVGRRDRSKLAEGMGWQVEAVQQALLDAGEDQLPPVVPVLCFVNGDWPFFRAPEEFDGVRLESELSIKNLVTRSDELPAVEIDRLTAILATALPSK